MAVKKQGGYLSDQQYQDIYSKVPRLCVDLFVMKPQPRGGIILTKRNIEPHKGLWHMPGGGIRKGESIKTAIARIAKQELGIEVEVYSRLIGTLEFRHENIPYWYKTRHSISLVYMVFPKTSINHKKYNSKLFSVLPADNTINPGNVKFLKENFVTWYL